MWILPLLILWCPLLLFFFSPAVTTLVMSYSVPRCSMDFAYTVPAAWSMFPFLLHLVTFYLSFSSQLNCNPLRKTFLDLSDYAEPLWNFLFPNMIYITCFCGIHPNVVYMHLCFYIDECQSSYQLQQVTFWVPLYSKHNAWHKVDIFINISSASGYSFGLFFLFWKM